MAQSATRKRWRTRKGLWRHRAQEKNNVPKEQRNRKRTGDTTIKSGEDLNQLKSSSDSWGMNRGTARGKRGKDNRAGHRYRLRKSSEGTRGAQGPLRS